MDASDTLNRDSLVGPWAGPPVPWTDEDLLDEEILRADVARICQAGVPGLFCGGTTGEFYAMEMEEFRGVSLAFVEECRSWSKPAMVGCTSTYTLGAAERAAWASEIGASAIFVALPYWMEVGEEYVVPFFFDVARASGNLPLCIYETRRAKKALTLAQHHAIKEAVPSYIMVAANHDTIGTQPAGCEALTPFVNVFVPEPRWTELCPAGAAAAAAVLCTGIRASFLDCGTKCAAAIGKPSVSWLPRSRLSTITSQPTWWPTASPKRQSIASAVGLPASLERACAAAGRTHPRRTTTSSSCAVGTGNTFPTCSSFRIP